MPDPIANLDCINIADRDIMVVHGIAFYRSTGTNTGEALQGTWFPMLGITHQQVNQSGVPKALMWPKYNKMGHHNVFEKPTPEAFMNTFDEKSNTGLSKDEIYTLCHTNEMKRLPVFLHTNFKHAKNIEAARAQRLDKEQAIFDLIKPDKKAEISDRFLHERLLAISASIGGGLWLTEEGKKTKTILKTKYPEYFTHQIVPKHVPLNTTMDDNPWGLKPNSEYDRQQFICRQANLWIKFKNGYLNDGNVTAFSQRVEHPELYPLQEKITSKFRNALQQTHSDAPEDTSPKPN